MYTTIKGGKDAIEQSHVLLEDQRRGDPSLAELTVPQIRSQLSLAVSRVMSEGALYDPELAALAVKQAQGDSYEACFLLRAFRTTLPRFGFSAPLRIADMTIERRIATVNKDVPGGQILGPTFDYTYRLLNFDLFGDADGSGDNNPARRGQTNVLPADHEELGVDLRHQTDSELFEIAKDDAIGAEVADLTREPLSFPTRRDQRLQNLTRGDEGFLVGLAYSSIRGYGRNHGFVAEIRLGDVAVDFEIPELGIVAEIGKIRITECTTIHPTYGQENEEPIFTKGYGIALGHCERKAIAMALVDRALRADEFAEQRRYPVQDEEFVLYHTDNIASSGMVQHLKLPHYVDFQAQVQLMADIAKERHRRRQDADVQIDEDDDMERINAE